MNDRHSANTVSEPKNKCLLQGSWLCQNRSFSSLWILDYFLNSSKNFFSKSVDTIFWDSENIQLFGIEDVQSLRANLWDFCQFGVWFFCPEPLISSHFWAPAQSPPWSHVNLLHPWHPLARSSLDLLFVCVSLFSAWPFSLTSQEKNHDCSNKHRLPSK